MKTGTRFLCIAGTLSFAISPAFHFNASAISPEMSEQMQQAEQIQTSQMQTSLTQTSQMQTSMTQSSGLPDMSSLTGISLPDRYSCPGLYSLISPMGGSRDKTDEGDVAEIQDGNAEHAELPNEQEQLQPVYHSIEDEPAVFPGTDDGYEGDFVLDVDFINAYEYQQCSDMIFLGDSRVVGMAMSAGGYHYIGKISMGYQWLVSEGVSLLTGKMNEYPQADIVLCLGINDLGNIESYIAYYRSLINNYPERRFWFLSVNPVSERLAAAHGYTVRNRLIEAFNARLQAAFPDRYIDCYTYLMENGVGTGDGVHYAGNTYSAIQDFSWRSISAQLDLENASVG